MAGLGFAEAIRRDGGEYGSAAKPAGEAALHDDAAEGGQGDGAFLLVIGSIATLEIAALFLWLIRS